LEVIEKYSHIPCLHVQDFTYNGMQYKPVFLQSLYEELINILKDEKEAKEKYVHFLKTSSFNTDNLTTSKI
jgi:hypothetical protein